MNIDADLSVAGLQALAKHVQSSDAVLLTEEDVDAVVNALQIRADDTVRVVRVNGADGPEPDGAQPRCFVFLSEHRGVMHCVALCDTWLLYNAVPPHPVLKGCMDRIKRYLPGLDARALHMVNMDMTTKNKSESITCACAAAALVVSVWCKTHAADAVAQAAEHSLHANTFVVFRDNITAPAPRIAAYALRNPNTTYTGDAAPIQSFTEGGVMTCQYNNCMTLWCSV